MDSFSMIFTIALALVVCLIFGVSFVRVMRAIREKDYRQIVVTVIAFIFALVLIYGGLTFLLVSGVM